MSKIVTNQISPRSGGTVSVDGNISVGGTLTYEDVTNIDSVGLITARNGIHVTSGNVGIATASPDNQLHVFGATTSAIKIETGDGGFNPIVIQENPDRTWHTGLRGDTSDSWVVRDATASSNRLVIDSSGRTLINTSSSIATEPDVQGYTPALQVVHAPSSASTNGVSINRFQAGNAFAAPLIFQKSKNDTIGSHTIVADNDELGDISFAGSDGAAFRTAARINVDVDGTPGSSDMPGRIQFSTTAVGAATPTERLRIDSSGKLIIPTGSPGIQFGSSDSGGVISSQTLNDYEEGTWTPNIGGDATYSQQVGYYVKTGSQVWIQFRITINVKGTGNSIGSIYGLPFPCGVAANVTSDLNWGGLAISVGYGIYYVGAGETTLYFSYNTGAATGLSNNPNIWTNSATMIGCMTYTTSSFS